MGANRFLDVIARVFATYFFGGVVGSDLEVRVGWCAMGQLGLW